MQILRSKIGVALGGGAAKGAAHLGVLKALEENHIPITAIAGTSVGAAVAALYAFGKTPQEIFDIANDLNMRAVSRLTLTRKKGFSTTDRIEKLFTDMLGDVNIEDASIPLAVIAADINTGEKKIFTQGNLAKAVAASAAVPGFFIPVVIDGREYVDGGIVENVPISALKLLGVNTCIAVNLNAGRDYPEIHDVMDVVSNALDIAINSKTHGQIQSAAVVVNMDLHQFSRTDNRERTQELVDVGYRLTMQRMDRIRWCLYTPLWQSLLRFYHSITPIIEPKFIRRIRGKTLD